MFVSLSVRIKGTSDLRFITIKCQNVEMHFKEVNDFPIPLRYHSYTKVAYLSFVQHDKTDVCLLASSH